MGCEERRREVGEKKGQSRRKVLSGILHIFLMPFKACTVDYVHKFIVVINSVVHV